MSVAGDTRPMLAIPQSGLGLPSAWPGADSAAGGLGPGDVWRIIKQRKWLIVITFVLTYIVVVAGTIAMLRYAPAYQSEALVEFVPPTASMRVTEETNLTREYIEREIATEAARMREQQLLMEVLAQPEIKETAFYRWYGNNFEKCLKELQDLLIISPVKDTYLIRVAIAVRSPKEATLIVNRIVERHLARSKEGVADEGRKRLDNFRATKSDVEKELAAVRQRIAARRAQRDMPALESDREVQVQVITTLNNTLAELQTRESDIETQLETIRGHDPRNLPVSAEMRIVIEADPVLRYYRQQVEALDIQIEASKESLLGENHRNVLTLRAQRENFFRKEAARRDELTDDLRARQSESLNQELARSRNVKITVREQLAERENVQRDLDSAIQELVSWQKDEERLSRQLESIEMSLREAETTTVARSRQGRLAQASQARDAVSPVRPNLAAFLGGGFLLSLVASVGLAFLRELTDQRVRTPVDVSRTAGLPVLGSIAELNEEEADVKQIELATHEKPSSMTADVFRQIRAHVVFSGPRESQRVLLITGPRPEDGSTAVAINLATAFAAGKERVLLVDCNFRRPGIHRAFPQTKKEGLSHLLTEQRALDQVVSRTTVPNLDVVTSGGVLPPNPGELLSSKAMHDLLAEAKQDNRYQRIILDAPPCLLVSDALILASQVEGVILVARAMRSTRGTLRRAKEQLARMGARVIGVVLNGVQSRPGGYFRQQYRDFYEYRDEELNELPGGAVDSLNRLADASGDEPPKSK